PGWMSGRPACPKKTSTVSLAKERAFPVPRSPPMSAASSGWMKRMQAERRQHMELQQIPLTALAGVQIGHAQDEAAATGCTVFLLGAEGAPAGLRSEEH